MAKEEKDGTSAASSGMPYEDMNLLLSKVVDFLKFNRNSVHSWHEFPFDQVIFGDYTPQQLSEEWNMLKRRAYRWCTMEMDLEVIQAFLKHGTFRKKGSNKLGKGAAPDKPKRPLSAYQFYMMEFVKKNKNVVPKYRFEEAAKAWQTLNEAAKQKYVQLALTAKEEYGEKLKKWVGENGEETKKRKTENRKQTPNIDEQRSGSRNSKRNIGTEEGRSPGFHAFFQVKAPRYAKKYEGETLKIKLYEKFEKLSPEKQAQWAEYASSL